MRVLLLAALLCAAAFARAPGDHCSPYLSCQTCVAQPLCGWCSEDVVYPGNITGPQCAGFNSNGSTPFACNGIYSTEQCVSGYVCNETDFTCVKGQPGQGNTLPACESNCTNNGQIYLCNKTSKKCYEVPRGTPGGSSYAVCEAACTHPSSHPSSSSPQPPPTPAPLYSCNFTSGQCEQAAAGKGEALSVCEQQCQKSNVSYLCNKFLSKCIQLPPGVHGDTMAQCEAECQVKPVPGPPSGLVGLWRGIRIDNNYIVGEYDLSVNQTAVVLIGHFGSSAISTIIGAPFHVPNSQNPLEMWIQVTSGPGTGQWIKTISDQSGENGPETSFTTTAMSQPGGAVPASINAAMTDSTEAVFAFAKCIDLQNCKFALRGSSSKFLESRLSDSDHCTQWGDSCQDCLAHQYCGWCSVNVTYKDGTTGSQCAGFNSGNGSSAFVCAGRYSTLECDTGYVCSADLTCVQTTPGNGMPLAECQQICRVTPKPKPQDLYTCNITTKQCIKCNQSHCPGEMPLTQCEAACTHPKPGPAGNLVGVWRGIRIQNQYLVGEVEAVFTNTSATFYADGKQEWTANVTSLGADLMILKVLSGKWQGWTISAIYQTSGQYNNLYSFITFAKGVPGRGPPSSYPEAMYTPPMEEYVYAKCASAPCKFNTP